MCNVADAMDKVLDVWGAAAALEGLGLRFACTQYRWNNGGANLTHYAYINCVCSVLSVTFPSLWDYWCFVHEHFVSRWFVAPPIDDSPQVDFNQLVYACVVFMAI